MFDSRFTSSAGAQRRARAQKNDVGESKNRGAEPRGKGSINEETTNGSKREQFVNGIVTS